ncbi:MAG: hypothetical protein WD651_04560, partial [Acidimicrobiia bacterium]
MKDDDQYTSRVTVSATSAVRPLSVSMVAVRRTCTESPIPSTPASVVRPRPRWGFDRPTHPELTDLAEAGRERYAATLGRILAHADALRAIPVRPSGTPQEPHWLNGFLPGLDAAAIYTFMAERRPARYVEIGSGNSTRFTARAIRDHGL